MMAASMANTREHVAAVTRLLATGLACCAIGFSGPTHAGHLEGVHQAFAEFEPTKGNSLSGRILITAARGRVMVAADFKGLAPGPHGLHVHELGDCSAPDAISAGGHFNPHGGHHGESHDAGAHLGDLGNVIADANGNAELRKELKGLAVEPGEADSIVGRSVVLHAEGDDLRSQPSGNAGARIACGVLQAR